MILMRAMYLVGMNASGIRCFIKREYLRTKLEETDPNIFKKKMKDLLL